MDFIHLGNIRIGERFVKLSNFFDRLPVKSILSVMRLFFAGCPSAVIRSISKIIIDSINRQIVLISIGKGPISKNLKASPFVTNLNVCTTVSKKTAAIRVFTSLAHTLPNFVKPTSTHIMRSKRLSASAWSAIQALIGMIGASLKDLLTPVASEVKVFPSLHKTLQFLSVIHYNKDWGYIQS